MHHNDDTSKEKTYKCPGCGSESKDEPGECCGGPRKEKCEDCGTARTDEGKCTCG